MNKFEVGDLVKSTQGRDKENIFIVKEKLGEDYVLLVDGKERRLEKPKKKKIKHIISQNVKSDILKEKFQSGKLVQDAEIRKVIRNISE